MQDHEKDRLERMIDEHGLVAVLDTLHDICAEKADHVESNWQDQPLAREWTDAANAISAASCAVPEL